MMTTTNLETCTVRIETLDGYPQGTGFVITPDHAVTCAHVVAACGAGPSERVHLSFRAGGASVEAEVLTKGYLPEADVAFLRLSAPLPRGVTPAILSPSVGLGGARVRAFGYPNVGDVDGLWGTGELAGRVTQTGQPLLQLRSTQITAGFSGGPVWEETSGRVIGMVTSVAVPDDLARLGDVAFAILAETLRDLCAAVGLELRPAENLHQPSGGRETSVTLSEASTPIRLDAAITKLQPKVWGPQVRQIARQWVKRHWLIHRALIQRLDEIHLVQWPTAVYAAQCQATYRIKKAKALGRLPSILNPDDWEIVDLTSKPIRVELAIPVISTAVSIPVSELELMQKAVAAINGFGPRNELDWASPHLGRAMYQAGIASAHWIYEQSKRFGASVWRGIDDSPPVFWPNLAIANKRLGLLHSDLRREIDERVYFLPNQLAESVLKQARATIEQEISRAIQKASSEGKLSAVSNYRDEVLLACEYPFWVVEVNAMRGRLKIVIDALSGDVVYSMTPLGTVSRTRIALAIGLIVAAGSLAIVAIIILLALLLPSR